MKMLINKNTRKKAKYLLFRILNLVNKKYIVDYENDEPQFQELEKYQKLNFESIINTYFTGEIIDTTKVGSFKAVIPKITGRAYLIGLNQWVIDPEDPIIEGFLLGRKTD